MTGSTIGIILIVVVVAAAMTIWITMVFRAERNPSFRNRHQERWPGKVRGSMHKGNALSPRRDEPVNPSEEQLH